MHGTCICMLLNLSITKTFTSNYMHCVKHNFFTQHNSPGKKYSFSYHESNIKYADITVQAIANKDITYISKYDFNSPVYKRQHLL